MKSLSFIVIISLIFSGCSLGWEKVDLVDHIPKEIKPQTFPHDCQWKRVKTVYDGDTIRTHDGTKIRFLGVDAPEINHPTIGEEPGGQEAKQFIEQKISSKICLLQSITGDKIDKYKRTLGYVLTEDGTHLNLEIIKAGLADSYRKFPHDLRDKFHEAEANR